MQEREEDSDRSCSVFNSFLTADVIRFDVEPFYLVLYENRFSVDEGEEEGEEGDGDRY